MAGRSAGRANVVDRLQCRSDPEGIHSWQPPLTVSRAFTNPSSLRMSCAASSIVQLKSPQTSTCGATASSSGIFFATMPNRRGILHCSAMKSQQSTRSLAWFLRRKGRCWKRTTCCRSHSQSLYSGSKYFSVGDSEVCLGDSEVCLSDSEVWRVLSARALDSVPIWRVPCQNATYCIYLYLLGR